MREGRISTDVSFNYELTLTAGIGEYEIILIFIEVIIYIYNNGRTTSGIGLNESSISGWVIM